MNDLKQDDIYVFVDESGSITKVDIDNHRYFVLAMVFTNDPVAIRRLYKKKISQMMRKNDTYKDMVISSKEIKGSDISETTKKAVYDHIFNHGEGKIEIGLIVLDNEYANDKFIENHPRAINYMIQLYLDCYYRKHSQFMSGSGQMHFIIDEQNIATNAKYTLEGYLNQQLSLMNPICNQFSVKYVDSKEEKLVQLADFIANSFYRNIAKKNNESKPNINMMMPFLCNRDIFDFSESHDINVHL